VPECLKLADRWCALEKHPRCSIKPLDVSDDSAPIVEKLEEPRNIDLEPAIIYELCRALFESGKALQGLRETVA